MIVAHNQTRFTLLYPFLLLPALLLVAHALISVAIISFAIKANGYPIPPVGLTAYTMTILLTFAYLLTVAFWPHKVTRPHHLADKLLLAILSPALVSLILAATLWIMPWLGEAEYAPYDSGDADVVLFFNLIVIALLIVVTVGYRSQTLLNVGFAVLFMLYFFTHTFPHWLRFPEIGLLAGILGIRPSTFLLILGAYLGATAVLSWRKQRVALPPHWQAAIILSNLAAGWMAYVLLSWFPKNGTTLGWRSATTIVPTDAWGTAYTFAQALIIVAMIAPILISGISIAIRRTRI